jgi:hypothetical protein
MAWSVIFCDTRGLTLTILPSDLIRKQWYGRIIFNGAIPRQEYVIQQCKVTSEEDKNTSQV